MNNTIIIIFLTIFSFTFLSAQNQYCGTKPHRSESLINFQQNKEHWVAKRGSDPFYIRVVCHIVGDDQGNGYIDRERLFQQQCETNAVYEKFGVKFYIDEIRYINNSDYYSHNFNQGHKMMYENNVDNAVNLYFVNDPAGNCGYFSHGPDAIALKKSCLGPGSYTWAHELGHYFSLPHTFNGWENRDYNPNLPTPSYVNGQETELVDGSNCESAGDGFCDTPPDYLSYRWNCNPDSLSSIVLKDRNEEEFRVEGKYIMSYSSGDCRGVFSEEQQNAMKYNMMEVRNLSGEKPNIPSLDSFQLQGISPDMGEEIYFDGVTFSWDPVDGAIGYILQYTFMDKFNSFATKIFTTTPSVVPDTIYKTWEKIYWRVKPLGSLTTCAEYSQTHTFRTVSTSTINTELQENRKVFPNPISSNQYLKVHTEYAFNDKVKIKIYNATGQLVQSVNQPKHYGKTLSFKLDGLSSGIHFLEVSSQAGKSVHKLLVTD